LKQEIDSLRNDNEILEKQLHELTIHADPIAEVKRLSSELSRRAAEHARERESLYRRIEQLQVDRNHWRAA